MTGSTMSDLTEFAVVNICRSDGQDTGPGYWPAPTDAAKAAKKTTAPVDKIPRAKPQMVRLAEDDPRFQEWRVKLGILLKQELSPTEGLPWLLNFPRGYWLYEKSKHLWVSGYPSKSKLYKSPQEFGLHLLWLLSSSTDRMDCRCIHCNIREVPNIEELTVTDTPRALPGPANPQPPSKMRKVTPQMPLSRTASPAPAAAATPPTSVKKETPVPVPTPSIKKETPVPVPAIPRAAPISGPAPSQSQPGQAPIQPTQFQPSQPPVQTPAQTQSPAQVAAQPLGQTPVQHVQQVVGQGPYQQPQIPPYPPPFLGIQPAALFRAGEMVWFQMSSGWRIGIVSATGIINPKNSKPETLQILPISHFLFGQSPVHLIEASARPFLAFSVPGVGTAELQDKPYDQVPWESFLGSLSADDTHRREVILLDSSKMAAQKIGQSFSLFTRVSTTEDGKKTDYNGIFLGAERVELGDVLRIRISPDHGLPEAAAALPDALLGLREICTAVDMPGSVFFKGDIYQPISGDSQPVGGMPVSEDKLPRALREECAFRFKFAPTERWRCVLLRHNAVLREGDLKGRFYPSHKLLPLLEGQSKVLAEAQKGIVRDAQQRLNQRTDTFKTGYIGLKTSRVDTIGPALPPNSVIQFGPEVREEET
ncbi:transcription-silencing protein clr2 [Colletotrichum karsti]|uniref:Transcription-silencing protein clr2 n=1 Tax=Colletotrichum karsti TaxID=1095194 RepID=A0A9P6LR50_9PEZI|nr:transcription-silencing protein clr2 [Colletotrichum karsti]KAF9881882.1 transcription-silencing protein clr2 [Colletotrichum karsti]